MLSCGSCGELTKNQCVCDHCGTRLKVCLPGKQAAAMVALGLMLTGCPPEVEPGVEYGSATVDDVVSDRDDDGHDDVTDCDDNDATVYPGAPETVGDGIDSNCDGEDDT